MPVNPRFNLDPEKVPENPEVYFNTKKDWFQKNQKYFDFISDFKSVADSLAELERTNPNDSRIQIFHNLMIEIQNNLWKADAFIVHRVPDGAMEAVELLKCSLAPESAEKNIKVAASLENAEQSINKHSGVDTGFWGALKIVASALAAALVIKVGLGVIAVACIVEGCFLGGLKGELIYGAARGIKTLTTDLFKTGVSDVVQAVGGNIDYQKNMKAQLQAMKSLDPAASPDVSAATSNDDSSQQHDGTLSTSHAP
jgi:hypothetical protein